MPFWYLQAQSTQQGECISWRWQSLFYCAVYALAQHGVVERRAAVHGVHELHGTDGAIKQAAALFPLW
jgi:hypothetical protein